MGRQTNSEFLHREIERDKNGFIIYVENIQTSLGGVFSVGDVYKGSTARAASASGEGATVAFINRPHFYSEP